MTRQVITPRFVLRPQRCTTTRCDTAPTMTLRRDASPASPGRRPAIAGSSTPPSALLSRRGKQSYLCQDPECHGKTFICDYSDLGRLPQIKKRIIEMSLNGSGIRDIARVLKISPSTVIEEIKKETELSAVNTVLLCQLNPQEV